MGHGTVIAKTIFAFWKFMVRRLFLVFPLVLLSSCFNQGDCLVTSTSVVKIGLRKKLDGSAKVTSFLSVKEVFENDTLTFPVLQNVPLELIALPVDPNHLSTTFEFITSDSLKF